MKLWLVADYARWGFSLNVVRAETKEEAAALVVQTSSSWIREEPEVTPLPSEGKPGIVWTYDHSPDSPRES